MVSLSANVVRTPNSTQVRDKELILVTRFEHGKKRFPHFHSYDRRIQRQKEHHLQLLRSPDRNCRSRENKRIRRQKAVAYGRLVGIRAFGRRKRIRRRLQVMGDVSSLILSFLTSQC